MLYFQGLHQGEASISSTTRFNIPAHLPQSHSAHSAPVSVQQQQQQPPPIPLGTSPFFPRLSPEDALARSTSMMTQDSLAFTPSELQQSQGFGFRADHWPGHVTPRPHSPIPVIDASTGFVTSDRSTLGQSSQGAVGPGLRGARLNRQQRVTFADDHHSESDSGQGIPGRSLRQSPSGTQLGSLSRSTTLPSPTPIERSLFGLKVAGAAFGGVLLGGVLANIANGNAEPSTMTKNTAVPRSDFEQFVGVGADSGKGIDNASVVSPSETESVIVNTSSVSSLDATSTIDLSANEIQTDSDVDITTDEENDIESGDEPINENESETEV